MMSLRWYAAFHDTTHHPHIHLLVYSTNPKQGFLTREGIDKIRSVLTNDIFHDDLQSIYQEQTLSRDELKAVSKTEFENIIQNFRQSDFDNPQLENLIRKLHSKLQNIKGKKVYGYLSPEVKETVNNIFSELAKDDNISQLYDKWCSLERLKYKTYTQKEKELPQLVDNKVFQPVRNMIIKAVLDMNNPAADIEVNPHEPIEQYAQNVFDNTEKIENEMLANTILTLFINLSRCIEDDYHNKFQSGRKMIESKLRKMIQDKKQALGIKQEHGQTQEY